jgi:endonuclease/exonuclease/phosphatase family metal-dependent hydrolase
MTDTYVAGYPGHAPLPLGMPGPVAVPATPALPFVPMATQAPSASIPSMLEALRNFLSSVGSQLGALIGPPPASPSPAPPTAPPPATGPVTPPAGSPDKQPPGPKANKATTFVISSFNILGSNHTAPGGGTTGYASGKERIREAVKLLEDRKVDVVGFQELQNDQAKEIKQIAGDTYGLYPGNSMGPRGSQNSIAWRKDKFKVVEAYTVKMPSHRGMLRETPVMRLRDKQTGEEVYIVNVHNAPGFHKGGAQQHWRDKATDLQVDLLNRLKRSGIPVVLTGDMNEKENYFRRMSREADMNAANELPNGQLPKRLGIDWIFGSQDVTFKGFQRLGDSIAKKISDHPMLVSKVKIEAPQ